MTLSPLKTFFAYHSCVTTACSQGHHTLSSYFLVIDTAVKKLNFWLLVMIIQRWQSYFARRACLPIVAQHLQYQDDKMYIQ